jgi:DNA polymerase V
MLYVRTINPITFVDRYNRSLHSFDLDPVSEIYELPADRPRMAVPLMMESIQAGFPSPAESFVKDRVSPDTFLIDNEVSTFMVRVRGDSMIDKGLYRGDIVVVDKSRDERLGDIVVAVCDGDFTIKILGRGCLLPANPAYSPLYFHEFTEVSIWGVVTGSMRRHV